MKKPDTQVSALLVQKHQLEQSEHQLADLDAALEALNALQTDTDAALDEMILAMDGVLEHSGITFNENIHTTVSSEFRDYLESGLHPSSSSVSKLSMIETIAFTSNMDWETYSQSVSHYAHKHKIDLTVDPFSALMSLTQRIALEKRIQEDFTLKTARCDKYDYMIAGTCGVIGGLIDIFLVGAPGEGKLTRLADNAVDNAVEKFASALGWEGGKNAQNPTKSAIGFLEGKFKVNYDHRHGGDVDGLFRMNTKNHHIKSLAHSPGFSRFIFLDP